MYVIKLNWLILNVKHHEEYTVRDLEEYNKFKILWHDTKPCIYRWMQKENGQ